MVLLDDLYVHAALQAPLAQIEGDTGTADNKEVTDLMLYQAQIAYQLSQVVQCGGDKESVAPPAARRSRRGCELRRLVPRRTPAR